MTLPSFEGLEIVPVEVLRQGTKKITQYLLDLFSSPWTNPLYRCKLMITGAEEPRNSLLVDCLFSLAGRLFQRKVHHQFFKKDEAKFTSVDFVLRGNVLMRKVVGSDYPYEETALTSNWRISENNEHEYPGFTLFNPNGGMLNAYSEHESERNLWIQKLRETLGPVADRPVTRRFFKDEGRGGQLELSLWNFPANYASQGDFLSTRTLFLVVWNLDEYGHEVHTRPRRSSRNGVQDQQGKGLDCVAHSLSEIASHLGPQGTAAAYYSIIVVGTNLERLAREEQARKIERFGKVQNLAQLYQLTVSKYVEVSGAGQFANVAGLQGAVFNEIAGMRSMGERVPEFYLEVERLLTVLRGRHQAFPVVGLEHFYSEFSDRRLVVDALKLLSQWGKCIFVEGDDSRPSMVIVDPLFLNDSMLLSLLPPENQAMPKKKSAIVSHEDLEAFWVERAGSHQVTQLIQPLIFLMQERGICFVLPEDQGQPFNTQRCVFFSMLEDRPSDRAAPKEIEQLESLLQKMEKQLRESRSKLAHWDALRERDGMNDRGRTLLREGENERRELEIDISTSNAKLESLRIIYQGGTRPWYEYWPDFPFLYQGEHFGRVFQFRVVTRELFRQVISALRDLIEGDCVARDFLLLRNGGTQANVKMEPRAHQIIVDIRAPNLAQGQSLLTIVASAVTKTAAAVFMSPLEGVRSPVSANIIPLPLIEEAQGSTLKFGEDQSVSVKWLREQAGLVGREYTPMKESKLSSSPLSVLSSSSPAALTTQSFSLSLSFCLLACLVHENDEKWPEFCRLFELLGGNLAEVSTVYDIQSSNTEQMFEGYRAALYCQHYASPEKFHKGTHMAMKDAGVRMQYLDHLEDKYDQYEMGGKEGKCRVLPVVHGTSEGVASKIAHGGFGIVVERDKGFFGQGIYFSSQVEYVKQYSNQKAGRYSSVLVLSLVTPGNAFPVTEDPYSATTMLGSSCQLGYQSHYVVVDESGKPSTDVTPEAANEIVVFDKGQVLPKFIVCLRSDPSSDQSSSSSSGAPSRKRLRQAGADSLELDLEETTRDFGRVILEPRYSLTSSRHAQPFDALTVPMEYGDTDSLQEIIRDPAPQHGQYRQDLREFWRYRPDPLITWYNVQGHQNSPIGRFLTRHNMGGYACFFVREEDLRGFASPRIIEEVMRIQRAARRQFPEAINVCPDCGVRHGQEATVIAHICSSHLEIEHPPLAVPRSARDFFAVPWDLLIPTLRALSLGPSPRTVEWLDQQQHTGLSLYCHPFRRVTNSGREMEATSVELLSLQKAVHDMFGAPGNACPACGRAFGSLNDMKAHFGEVHSPGHR